MLHVITHCWKGSLEERQKEDAVGGSFLPFSFCENVFSALSAYHKLMGLSCTSDTVKR